MLLSILLAGNKTERNKKTSRLIHGSEDGVFIRILGFRSWDALSNTRHVGTCWNAPFSHGEKDLHRN